jgi:hypothetical protein
MIKKLEEKAKEGSASKLTRFGHYLLDIIGTIMDGRTMHKHVKYGTSADNESIHPYFTY